MSTISSKDVRRRAIEAYRSGHGSQTHIAQTFGISRRTFQLWLRDYHQEGRLEPHPRGHNPAKFSGTMLTALDTHVEKHPDATLVEIQTEFSDRVSCSDVTIHNTLQRLGWRYKKNGYERVNKTDPT